MSISEKIELINNITTICLVIIALSASASSILEERKRFVNLFAVLLIANVSIDMISFFVAGKGFAWAHTIIMVVNTVNLFIRMATAGLTVYYNYEIEKYKYLNGIKGYLVLCIPAMIGVVFLFINIFTEIIFSVDSEGYYTSNNGIYIINAIIFIYIFVAVVLSLLGRNNAGMYPFVPMFVIAIPIVVGVVIRAFFLPQVPVGILGGSISLIIYVLSMSNAAVLFDSFTRVYNKDYLNYFFNRVNKSRINKVAGIMIDVNDLKIINDKYGHQAGDEAILKTVNIIKSMDIKNSAFVRFGGDEFILLISISDIETVRDVMLNIKEKIFQLETENTAPYKISLSMGTTLYIPGEKISSFIRRMDEQMYFEKKSYHEAFVQ